MESTVLTGTDEKMLPGSSNSDNTVPTGTDEKMSLDSSNSDVISICDTESDSDESSDVEIIEDLRHIDVIELDDTPVEDSCNGDTSVISIRSDSSAVSLKTTCLQTKIVHFDLDTTPDYIPVINYKSKDGKIFTAKRMQPRRSRESRYENFLKKLATRNSDKKNSRDLHSGSVKIETISVAKHHKYKKRKLGADGKEMCKLDTDGLEICEPDAVNKEKCSRFNPKLPTRIIQLSYPNILNDKAEETRKVGLRPIIIDGCNVGFGYGTGSFEMRGNILVIQYFKNRGHDEIVCFLQSRYEHRTRSASEQRTVDSLTKENVFAFTPSRNLDNGKRYVPYDDRYILQYATERQGIIISNDGYRDLINEEPSWRETIENRIINYTFARGIFMLPKDPLGPDGPTLDEMLKFP